MKTSNEINELAAALSKAQAQFTPVLKKAKGVHNSSYAEFIEFIEMAKPHLGEHGLSIVQFPFNENGHVGIINRLMHSSGQWMEHDFGVPPSKHDTHAYGSAITYTKRYCYGSILGIPTTDDDGNLSMGLDNPSQKPLRTISGAQLNTLVTLLDNDLDLERRIIEATGVSDLSRLPESQYSAILARLKSLKA
tara:strand:- start:7326 stop:7901 length:576 start_codon:yes stop_codon:yes gene_type:complete